MTKPTPDMTVSAAAADLPGAAELFRSKGINFCCGGNVALSDAALKAGMRPEQLIAELQSLADAAGREAPEDTLALIDHILGRYHETHRAELQWLIPLAQKVERVHGDHEAAPLGLTEALIALQEDLETHMAKEEAVLFPLMRQGGNPMIVHPIAQMRLEHDDTARLLTGLEHVTHGLALPEGACGSWTALYTGLRKFTEDLVAHMHLENTVLFARFEPAHA
ncbi:MAG: iron-sulfur cluster repair di-iron protein [Paracoccaceae bacterium]